MPDTYRTFDANNIIFKWAGGIRIRIIPVSINRQGVELDGLQHIVYNVIRIYIDIVYKNMFLLKHMDLFYKGINL